MQVATHRHTEQAGAQGAKPENHAGHEMSAALRSHAQRGAERAHGGHASTGVAKQEATAANKPVIIGVTRQQTEAEKIGCGCGCLREMNKALEDGSMPKPNARLTQSEADSPLYRQLMTAVTTSSAVLPASPSVR